MPGEELLTIGEVSRRTGVAPSALHYYERIGLITSTRTRGNQRRYHRHMIRRVSLVAAAKNLGISLADVRRALADVPLQAPPTRADWERASARWKNILRQRRRTLQRLEEELTGCIGCGCLSMDRCTLLNPGDTLGAEGAGPRRLETGRGDMGG
ncbi:MAG TPA: redox-sensitive transcriptional activator SoxR [Beutenbergiaceae bacterium]|nr:redox-sensitive transcriptional activator SoxR [Beutenbergiaceae bacterium]